MNYDNVACEECETCYRKSDNRERGEKIFRAKLSQNSRS
jgi:hypothetical protein